MHIVKYIVTMSWKPYLPRDEYEEGWKENNAPQSFSHSNYSDKTLCLLQNKLSYCFTLTLLFHIHPFPFKSYLTLQVLCGLLMSTFILTALLKADRQFLYFVNVPYRLVLYHQQLITVTPCSLIEIDHCFGGTCCLHLQLRNMSQRGHIRLRYGDWRIGHCTIS